MLLPRTSQTVPVTSHAPVSPIRRAAIDFIRGTTFGWGRRELATWLACQYSPCLAADATTHPDATPGKPASSESVAPSLRLDDDMIERLILDARAGVLTLLADLPWPSEVELHAQAAIASGHVIATHDPSGERRWAPVGRRRMRLVERVSSLLVVDAMCSPNDYRNLSLCRSCGELLFGSKEEHEPRCDDARRVA